MCQTFLSGLLLGEGEMSLFFVLLYGFGSYHNWDRLPVQMFGVVELAFAGCRIYIYRISLFVNHLLPFFVLFSCLLIRYDNSLKSIFVFIFFLRIKLHKLLAYLFSLKLHDIRCRKNHKSIIVVCFFYKKLFIKQLLNISNFL